MSHPPLTADGFLEHHEDWTPDIAQHLAQEERLSLNDKHWEVIRFVRDFYQHYQYSPIQRFIVKHLKTQDATSSSMTLQTLFPQGPRQICRIAGLPKPARCT